MKNYYFIFLLLFLSFICNSKNKVSSGLTCLECIHEIIHSSDAYLLNYENYKTRIERITGDSIIIQAYVINNIGDTGSEPAYITSTLGWFLLLPNQQKLYNISADPDNPIKLNFDTKLLENNPSLISNCSIDRKQEKTQIPEKEVSSFEFIYSKLNILNISLPFTSESNMSLVERTSKWENLFSEYKINLENLSQNEELISFTCGDKIFNYYPLVQINDLKVVLSPSQCGDFYHVFLLIFNKEELKSSIYVDGLYSNPEEINESLPKLENTYFSINDKNDISIYKKINDEITISNYQIQDDGKLKQLK